MSLSRDGISNDIRFSTNSYEGEIVLVKHDEPSDLAIGNLVLAMKILERFVVVEHGKALNM